MLSLSLLRLANSLHTSPKWLAALTIAVFLSAHSTGHAADSVRLLVLGDSLTAGYGLPKGESFTDQLSKALTERGLDVRVINAGVSGDTTAGGLARLDWALADKPQAAIVALGGNDGLRGLAPGASRDNMEAIVGKLKARRIKVLVAGMLAPPNLGREFGEEFNAVFPAVAKAHDVMLYPFFLEGVAADPALNQPDGIHPNAKGVDVIVQRMLPSVIQLIEQVSPSEGPR